MDAGSCDNTSRRETTSLPPRDQTIGGVDQKPHLVQIKDLTDRIMGK